MPWERNSILQFVRDAAAALPAGAVMVDIGAGDAPYRELFDHCGYIATDWSESVHEYAGAADVVASAEALPLLTGSADAVLLTQVLEHVADPGAVIEQAARVLKPGGALFATVPFVWELHELPHDYWRFTPASLARLLRQTGFVEIEVKPRTDCFTTLAQLTRNLCWGMGRAPDGRDPERERAAELLNELAEGLAELSALDVEWSFPLGWTATAKRR